MLASAERKGKRAYNPGNAHALIAGNAPALIDCLPRGLCCLRGMTRRRAADCCCCCCCCWLMGMTHRSLPNAKLLRLLRVGKVIRLVSSLKDLQRIIGAVTSAVVPVCNAFLLVLIISCVYAIVGRTFFIDTAPEFFADFHTGLFTMMQILSGDSWASSIARTIFDRLDLSGSPHPRTDPLTAFFFVSYVLIVSTMLLNVVVVLCPTSRLPPHHPYLIQATHDTRQH